MDSVRNKIVIHTYVVEATNIHMYVHAYVSTTKLVDMN